MARTPGYARIAALVWAAAVVIGIVAALARPHGGALVAMEGAAIALIMVGFAVWLIGSRRA